MILIIRKKWITETSEFFCNHRIKDNFVTIFIFGTEEIGS